MKLKVLILLFAVFSGMVSLSFAEIKSNDPAQVVFQLYEEERFDEALIQADLLLQSFPGRADILNLKAKVFLAQGQWDLAIQECERIQQSDPLFHERHLSLGRAYLGKERAKDALREFDEAERQGIQVPGVYHDLAVLYAYGKDYDGAIRTAQGAVGKNPGYLKGYYAIGRFYMETERYAEAIPYLENVLTLDEDHAEAKEYLAVCYVNIGKLNQAGDLAAEILEDDPGSSMARLVIEQVKILQKAKKGPASNALRRS